MNNKKGFAIAGVLYPILILFLALMALLLMNLTQENYRLRKSVKDLTSKINGEEPKDAFKQKVEDIINCNGVENCAPSCTNFGLSDGAMSPSYGYTGDTSDLNGRFYKMMDGRTGVLIDDGTYCAYKTTGMQKLAVGEGKECENAILDDTGTGIGLICPTDEELEASCNNTINSLKTTIASATASAGDVLEGRTYVKPDATIGNGTMPNNGAITQTINPGESYTILAGYHNGYGTVTANANTGTYTYASGSIGGVVDMGENNTYRYVDATNVYAKGKEDGKTDTFSNIASHSSGRGTGDQTVSFTAVVGEYYAIGLGYRNIENGATESNYGAKVSGGTVLLSRGGKSGTNGGGGLVIIKATSTTVKVAGGGVGWVRLST